MNPTDLIKALQGITSGAAPATQGAPKAAAPSGNMKVPTAFTKAHNDAYENTRKVLMNMIQSGIPGLENVLNTLNKEHVKQSKNSTTKNLRGDDSITKIASKLLGTKNHPTLAGAEGPGSFNSAPYGTGMSVPAFEQQGAQGEYDLPFSAMSLPSAPSAQMSPMVPPMPYSAMVGNNPQSAQVAPTY